MSCLSQVANINSFTMAAKLWNHDVFGNIHKRKNILLRILRGIQRVLSVVLNPFLENLQKQLWWEYEVTIFEEEALWAQKFLYQCFSHGYRNTRYFHSSTMARERKNRVLAFKDLMETVCTIMSNYSR